VCKDYVETQRTLHGSSQVNDPWDFNEVGTSDPTAMGCFVERVAYGMWFGLEVYESSALDSGGQPWGGRVTTSGQFFAVCTNLDPSCPSPQPSLPPPPPSSPVRDWVCQDYTEHVKVAPDICGPSLPSSAWTTNDWDRTDDSCAELAVAVRLPDGSVATVQPAELTSEADCADFYATLAAGTDYQIRGDLTPTATRDAADAFPWAQGNGCSYLPNVLISVTWSVPGQVLWQRQSGRVGFGCNLFGGNPGTTDDKSMKAVCKYPALPGNAPATCGSNGRRLEGDRL